MTVKIIQKKRNVFRPIVIYTFVASIMVILVVTAFKIDFKASIYTQVLMGVILAISLITSFYLTFIRWFPEPKGYKQQGSMEFDSNEIRRSKYGRLLRYSINQLFELRFHIPGQNDQKNSFNFSKGNRVLMILTTQDRTSKRIEFVLENQDNLERLMSYIESYKSQTNVIIS